MLPLKPIEFLGNSRRGLAAFPDEARRTAGFQLNRVQRGLEPELRVRDSYGAFRVVYVARFVEAIYVLHAFQKRSRKTSTLDLALIRTRYAELMRNRP